MAGSAYIKVKDGATGAVRSFLTAAGSQPSTLADSALANGYLAATVHRKRNGIDTCEFTLDYNNPDVAALVDKDQIEVIRSYPEYGIAEYTIFDGLYRDAIVAYNNGIQTFTCRAFGYAHMLSWRNISWKAKTTNRTVFTNVKAETIIKTLVDYNICANATAANGRIVDGALTGFSIEADGANGNTLSLTVSNENLFSVIEKIMPKAGGDIAVVRTGATTFQLRWHTGQLGTDRSSGAAGVVFSLERGNMGNPKLSRIRSHERTKAIIGGAGDGLTRIFTTQTGPNYNASTNNIELFVDGGNTVDTTVLQGAGTIKLEELKFRNVLDFDVLQIASCLIGKHYFLGDKIAAVFGGVTTTQYIDEEIYNYKTADEEIAVVMVDV